MKSIVVCTLCMIIFISQVSCGGARRKTQDTDACNKKATKILEGDTVCDPTKIDQFEVEIKNWQIECEAKAQLLTSNLINQKRINSKNCSEETSLFDNKRMSCRRQVEELQAKSTCEAEDCNVLLTSLKSLITECRSFEEEGTQLVDARRLQAEIETKVKEVASTSEIHVLAANCEKANKLASQGQTDEALTALILALANPIMQNELDKSEPENRAASETLSICKAALKITVDAHVKALAKELRKSRIKRNREKWMTYLRSLEGTLNRLREVGVPKILPDTIDEIEKLVLEFKKLNNVQESKTTDETGLAVKKALTGGVATCRELKADIGRFEAKIAEHSKAGNDQKVKAYTNKRIQMEQALETFETNINKSIDSRALPEDEMVQLVKDIKKAGCLNTPPAE